MESWQFADALSSVTAKYPTQRVGDGLVVNASGLPNNVVVSPALFANPTVEAMVRGVL